MRIPKTVWPERYRSITGLERHLHANGTRIIKFFLHLSKDEQRRRFIERIDKPSKNWKFSEADIEERKYWKDYMKAYEKCLGATSTKEAPWYVVPADDKENARLIVSQIVVQTLTNLKMSFPQDQRPARARTAGDPQGADALAHDPSHSRKLRSVRASPHAACWLTRDVSRPYCTTVLVTPEIRPARAGAAATLAVDRCNTRKMRASGIAILHVSVRGNS